MWLTLNANNSPITRAIKKRIAVFNSPQRDLSNDTIVCQFLTLFKNQHFKLRLDVVNFQRE